MHAGSTVTFNPPPSAVILEASKAGTLNESNIENLARKVLLPVEDVKVWLRHLMIVSENRKKGAQKAAMTRRLKRAAQHAQPSLELYHCGVWDELYLEEADEEQDWIACDVQHMVPIGNVYMLLKSLNLLFVQNVPSHNNTYCLYSCTL